MERLLTPPLVPEVKFRLPRAWLRLLGGQHCDPDRRWSLSTFAPGTSKGALLGGPLPKKPLSPFGSTGVDQDRLPRSVGEQSPCAGVGAVRRFHRGRSHGKVHFGSPRDGRPPTGLRGYIARPTKYIPPNPRGKAGHPRLPMRLTSAQADPPGAGKCDTQLPAC